MPIDPTRGGAGRRAVLLAAALLALLVLPPALSGAGPAARAAPAARPSFLVIQTDDQTAQELDSTWITALGSRARTMPRTIDSIRRRGIEFKRYYVSYPLCCPSRASLLSGRYAHNTRVLGNLPPNGGFTAFQEGPNYRHNIATWLHRSGYRTIHLGKFLNNYGHSVPETTIPPGWESWETLTPAGESSYYYGYHLNVNGRIDGPFGDPEYGPGIGEDDRRCSGAGRLLGLICSVPDRLADPPCGRRDRADTGPAGPSTSRSTTPRPTGTPDRRSDPTGRPATMTRPRTRRCRSRPVSMRPTSPTSPHGSARCRASTRPRCAGSGPSTARASRRCGRLTMGSAG